MADDSSVVAATVVSSVVSAEVVAVVTTVVSDVSVVVSLVTTVSSLDGEEISVGAVMQDGSNIADNNAGTVNRHNAFLNLPLFTIYPPENVICIEYS